LPVRAGDVLVVGQAGKITVAGQVLTPGSYVVGEPTPVLEAIARAGGLTPLADLRKATIVGEGQTQRYDIEKLWFEGGAGENVVVQPGQTLLIPERDPESVLVVGAVMKPGAVDIYRSRSRSVLRLIGGAEPKETADLGRVTIHRAGSEQPIVVNLRSAMEEGKVEANVAVQAEDIIFVPEYRKVYAIGAFTTPGVFPLVKDMTLNELVARAGSFRVDALQKRLYWQHHGPEGVKVIAIDYRQMERGTAPLTTDYRLAEGDVVFAPSRKQGSGLWSTFRDTLWATAGLLSVMRF
jgi:protein involved in polysaccharide export with SLBB domain